MDDPTMFVLTVLMILSTPGPTNTLLATSGAVHGVWRSLVLLPFESSGYLISILTLGLVVGPLLAASSALSIGLRLMVGVYLVWLGIGLWRQGSLLGDRPRIVGPRQVFITTLLNPKAIIFALGVVPFDSIHVWIYLLGFLVMLVIVGLGWILLGTGVGRVAHARGIADLVPRTGAVALALFAILIVTSPFLH